MDAGIVCLIGSYDGDQVVGRWEFVFCILLAKLVVYPVGVVKQKCRVLNEVCLVGWC